MSAGMEKTIIADERSLPFWPHLSEQERAAVGARASVVRYAAGQLVRGGDSDCIGFFTVLRGTLRAYLLSPEGREVTLYRLRAGECCVLGASCVLDAVSFETVIAAEEDSRIMLVPVDVYSALLRDNIKVERDAYKLATERFSEVVSGMERLVFMSLQQRLVSFLLDEASENGTDTVRMTHEQIAANIGSAREVVSRTLKAMSMHGLLELFRGGVRILDRPALYGLLE